MTETAAVRLSPALVADLHAEARAERWGLPTDALRAALEASAAHALRGGTPTTHGIERYARSLHVRDLAMATACAAGLEPAWDDFVREHRPALYRAADAIDPTGGARDLADSLYADLFGLTERQGKRQSLFRYFHGRSSLATWLRAVLAQRHVDRIRATRRLHPLPEVDSTTVSQERTDDPDRPRLAAALQQALANAVAELSPRDRLRLGCYYAQGMKLAAIGRLLGEHEATASRHLARTRGDIRAAVEQRLRDEHGLDKAAIAQSFQAAVEDAGGLDLADLVGAGADGKNRVPDRSNE